MTTDTSVREGTDTREATVPHYASRAIALGNIADLVARDGLPAPKGITFDDDDIWHLAIRVSSAEDFNAWVMRLNGYHISRDQRYVDTVQCHAYADWFGWRVTLGSCVPVRGPALATGGPR